MKKLIFSLILLTSTLFAEMNWTTYEKALESAKKQDKIVMIMLGRSTCGVCNYMKAQVFTEKLIIEKFNKKFIGVQLELDFDDIPEGLDYVGTPTFHFLNKKGEKIHRIDGGKHAKSFSDALDSVH